MLLVAVTDVVHADSLIVTRGLSLISFTYHSYAPRIPFDLRTAGLGNEPHRGIELLSRFPAFPDFADGYLAVAWKLYDFVRGSSSVAEFPAAGKVVGHGRFERDAGSKGDIDRAFDGVLLSAWRHVNASEFANFPVGNGGPADFPVDTGGPGSGQSSEINQSACLGTDAPGPRTAEGGDGPFLPPSCDYRL